MSILEAGGSLRCAADRERQRASERRLSRGPKAAGGTYHGPPAGARRGSSLRDLRIIGAVSGRHPTIALGVSGAPVPCSNATKTQRSVPPRGCQVTPATRSYPRNHVLRTGCFTTLLIVVEIAPFSRMQLSRENRPSLRLERGHRERPVLTGAEKALL